MPTMHRNLFLLCALFLFPLLSPAQKPELVVRQEAHIGYPTVTTFSSGGHYLLSGGDDRRLVLWDIISGRFIRRTECPARPLALCFAEQDETALALLADHSVIQWDLIAGQQETLLPSAEDSILLFQLSPGGQWALTFSANNTLRVRHTKDSRLNWQLTSAEAAAGLQFLPESQSVALWRSDGSVLGHWRLANGTALEHPPVLAWQSDSLLLDHGNGQRILQQKNQGLVYLSLNQGTALASRALPPDAFSGAETYFMIIPGAFAYAPDGRYLLTTVYSAPGSCGKTRAPTAPA